jgi:hypothetical protein
MQCQLATLVFNGSIDCCQNPQACDVPKPLQIALSRAEVYAGGVMSSIPPAAVSGHINAGRPLGCGIRWYSGGTPHFVVIYGFSVDFDGKPWVAVEDPKYGPWVGPHAEFRIAYRAGAGRWVATYYTA